MIPSRRIPGKSSNIAPIAWIVGSVAILYFARQVFIPFAAALTLTFLLAPAVMWLQRCRLSRMQAVIVVIALSTVAAATLGWRITGQLLNVLTELPSYQQNIHNRIEAFRSPQQGPLGKVSQTVKGISEELSTADTVANPPVGPNLPGKTALKSPGDVTQVQVVEPPKNVWQYLRDLASPLLVPLGEGTIVLVFTIFMLVKKEDLRNRLLRLAGVRQLNRMTEALDDAAARVSRYLLMQALVNATFGLLFGLGLYFIGLPNAALWGVLAGLLRIVPYVGTLVAAVFPITLSLAVFSTWLPPLLIFLLYAALELTIANFVEPWLYGTHTGISPFAILVTTVFWAMLWGPVGLILSTPLTVCLVVLGSHVPQLSFLHVLLGDQPVLAPEAQLYQRLLAMDQAEAREIADLFLKEQSLVELYDSVLIPALTLAEQDRHRGSLDQTREEFLFLNLNEMISEFSEREQDEQPRVSGRLGGRIICFPANDEADQITATMLAQLLEEGGYSVISFPVGAALRDLLAVEPGPEDVIVISAVPPFAFAHSKALYKQIHSRLPKVKVMVGIWGFSGDLDKAKARFERQQPETIVTTLAEATKYVAELQLAHA
jgi:predicted PurR-regulated permease PerM